jgi:tetratricopeptide (TPR) repeat protein
MDRHSLERVAARGILFALLLAAAPRANPQQIAQEAGPRPSRIASLQLQPEVSIQLKQAIAQHQYNTAETLLLPTIAQCHHNTQKVRLLRFIGVVYYLDDDYLHAAVAWEKSTAIAPLPPTLRFSLAMAYIQLHRPDWARKSIQDLARQYPQNALFPYWLGRLDYDAHRYKEAIVHFQHAVDLAPSMARAWNNLGLCSYYLNQNATAIVDYEKAIRLNTQAGHPSPWPYLNLAVTQQLLNQVDSAETNLAKSIRLDPKIPSAHLYLGNLLEHQGKLTQATLEYQRAAHLDASYPEPHFALARVYQRQGKDRLAKEQVKLYLKLRKLQSSNRLSHLSSR